MKYHEVVYFTVAFYKLTFLSRIEIKVGNI